MPNLQDVTRTLAYGAAAALTLLTACPQTEQPNGHTERQSAGRLAADAVIAEASLFTGTDYEAHPPQALDINRDGSMVFIKYYEPGGRDTRVYAHELTPAGLGQQIALDESGEMLRAFVRAHPVARECLLIGNTQLPDGPVIDTIWRTGATGRARARYNDAPGLPTDLPPDARYGLDPVYSWDGNQIIVPLHSGGLCIVETTHRGVSARGPARFIAYAELPGQPSGQACGALPPTEDSQLIYVSRWYIGSDAEWCHTRLLNIDTGEWSEPLRLESEQAPWVIYQVAGDDAWHQPWLVRGGRPPNKNTEHTRLPRLARVDPLSGAIELLLFYGRPWWPVVLEPHGSCVVFADRQRQAIVRLDPAAGLLDYDPRFYHDEARLFVGEGGSPVHVWQAGTLLRAEFSVQESLSEE
jgi:hypothetical protein